MCLRGVQINVCVSREQKSRNSYRQMAASKVEAESCMKLARQKLGVAQKKLKSFGDREDSLRDMRRQVFEAEVQLQQEQAARRRAEERHVVSHIHSHAQVSHIHACTHTPVCVKQSGEERKLLPRAT